MCKTEQEDRISTPSPPSLPVRLPPPFISFLMPMTEGRTERERATAELQMKEDTSHTHTIHHKHSNDLQATYFILSSYNTKRCFDR
mmetsp:Transcript_17831/g.26396  ORF Transcript_17831/g.26396 Transcript_17831/m.26396 type:complete len:86 (+) Transcript_17831:260-517(+)